MDSSGSEDTSSNDDGTLLRLPLLGSEILQSEEHFPALPGKKVHTPSKSGQSYASVLVGEIVEETVGENFGSDEANKSENSPGPGPQPLRGIFPTPQQQASQARNNPMSSARMPNGKLGTTGLGEKTQERAPAADNTFVTAGSGSGWGFGLPLGNAPGLPSTQTRGSSTTGAAASAMGNFSQGIGSSQPATPLDMS
jgi:hypothetical protein